MSTTSLPTGSRGPFLPTSQVFPDDAAQRIIVHNENYIDIAQAVNIREIGIYELTEQLNGKQFFNTSNPQQKRFSYRQVFQFSAAGSFAHNIANLTLVLGYGQFTDGTNFYGAIYGSSVAIAGQVSFYVTPTNIVVLSGAGAPVITSGIIVLDYLKN